MKQSTWLVGVVACLPLAANAQSPTDPNVAVPAVPYRSVFTDTPKGVETDTLEWKAANAQVGEFPRGHVDILKWEAAQPKPPAAAPASPSATETRKP
jgi:hypothetical protein